MGPADDLPRFALTVYRNDGVPAACLRLQDRFGVDVNLLLAAAYLGAVDGRTLSPDALSDLRSPVDAWHREVVSALRDVRRRLKSGPPPAPDTRTTDLRDKLKALEVEAEMIELSELGTAVGRIDLSPADGDAADRASAAIRVVVAAGAPETLTDLDDDAIGTIATAAAADTGVPK
jgi:uncharacterized protein (TIGR02444 family)